MEEILSYLNNYFYRFYEEATYTILTGGIDVIGKYVKGQYIRIEGSLLNDGVYQVEDVVSGGTGEGTIYISSLFDEVFEGTIYSLAIPNRLMQLSEKIKEYNATVGNSDIISESFGAYSYTKGQVSKWEDKFRGDLRQFRQIYDRKDKIPKVEPLNDRPIPSGIKGFMEDENGNIIGYN